MSEQQANICTAFNIMVRYAFPDSMVYARVANILGETIVITFTQKTQYSNNIAENDPAFMKFLVHVGKDGSAEINAPAMHSNATKDAGVKFRKIKAASEGDAMQKLAHWFIKNHDGIMAAKNKW
jgi:hypothetical protein